MEIRPGRSLVMIASQQPYCISGQPIVTERRESTTREPPEIKAICFGKLAQRKQGPLEMAPRWMGEGGGRVWKGFYGVLHSQT